MPNICTAVVYARGRKDSIDEFIKILQSDYEYGCNKMDVPYISHVPHFFRVFEAHVFDRRQLYGLVDFCAISIECAWSVFCCMFPGPFTYYDDFVKREMPKYYSNIILESKRLQLDVEIYSREPGVGFQEQYRLISGILAINKDYPYNEYYIGEYKTLQDWIEDYDGDTEAIPIKTEEEFQKIKQEDPVVYEINRINDDSTIDEPPKYIAGLVMVKPTNKEE